MQSELQADAVLNTEEEQTHVLQTSHLKVEEIVTLGRLTQSTNKIYLSIPFCSFNKEEKHVTESWE